MPFITITETAMASVVNERYDVLRRGAVVRQRLESLVLEERGLAEIAATVGRRRRRRGGDPRRLRRAARLP